MTVDEAKGKLAARAQGAERGKTVFDLLASQKAEIARALPAAMHADRFARIVATECRRTPRLMACTPVSFLGAVMLCAQLGLEPGPLGHAYLIPFRNTKTNSYEVQLIIGYRGYIDLALRSGKIESVVAREVCEHDTFNYSLGTDERITHLPKLTDRGDEVAYYAIARFVGGGQTFVVLSRDDVEARRNRSRAKGAGPWVTDYSAMAKKTAVRALAPYLPLTVETETALNVDEAVPTNFGPGMVEDIALTQTSPDAPDALDDDAAAGSDDEPTADPPDAAEGPEEADA